MKRVSKKMIDFLLAEFQKEMFSKYTSKLIFVDATHGTTAYDFQLITVLVTDNFEEGVPVAWMIRNKESTDTLRVFFKSLRERCGDLTTEFSMSDDADAYYNAWCRLFQDLTGSCFAAGTWTEGGAES